MRDINVCSKAISLAQPELSWFADTELLLIPGAEILCGVAIARW